MFINILVKWKLCEHFGLVLFMTKHVQYIQYLVCRCSRCCRETDNIHWNGCIWFFVKCFFFKTCQWSLLSHIFISTNMRRFSQFLFANINYLMFGKKPCGGAWLMFSQLLLPKFPTILKPSLSPLFIIVHYSKRCSKACVCLSIWDKTNSRGNRELSFTFEALGMRDERRLTLAVFW